MKKEVLLSIIIGAILGFGIMGIAWINNNGSFSDIFQKITSISPENDPQDSSEPVSPAPTQTEPAADIEKVQLSISSPENEIVVSQEKLDISGKTQPLATVVIIWEEGEDILVANEEGIFETQITLLGGPNEIEITAYGSSDDEVKKILTVTYSTAKF